ncbi:MAG: hypothetical protein NWR50_05565 [Crocinitomicaceae bacterium]|nr:hypothetical protein [Crocinitomicaceae bacterium]
MLKLHMMSQLEKLTLHETSSKYTIHQNQITTWKKEFLDKSEMVFSREKLEKVDENKEKELYSKIGDASNNRITYFKIYVVIHVYYNLIAQ